MLIEILRHAGQRTATPIDPDGVPGARARERVARADRVVHAYVVIDTSDTLLNSVRRHLVLDQRQDVVALEPLSAVQERELDDERNADDGAAELLDELDGRFRGPSGREDVVVDKHALARPDRVGVHLELVEAVLERVLR